MLRFIKHAFRDKKNLIELSDFLCGFNVFRDAAKMIVYVCVTG